MPLFKNTRDTLKANGMMSHLECAVHHFRPRDIWQCEHHLCGAQKALTKVKRAKAEYILAEPGWQYVARLAAQLDGQLRQHGFEELARSAREIGHYACLVLVDREQPTSDSELAIAGPVDEDGFLIDPPPPRQVYRDDILDILNQVQCPSCGFRGRIPSDQGMLHITCSQCGHEWDVKSPSSYG